ncbi:MAG: hypothetical protein ACXVP2_12030 [Tumebacillaceae bacterium]
MGIIVGIVLAVIVWKLLKLSVMAVIWLAIIGAIVGAIPTFMNRMRSRR